MQISLQLLSVCSAASITQNRKLHICWRCDTGHCNWGANLRTKGQRSKVTVKVNGNVDRFTSNQDQKRSLAYVISPN